MIGFIIPIRFDHCNSNFRIRRVLVIKLIASFTLDLNFLIIKINSFNLFANRDFVVALEKLLK